MPRIAAVAIALVLALLAAGCGTDDDGGGSGDTSAGSGTSAGQGPGASAGLPQGDEPVRLDPALFTTRIDNPYWPMTPGTRWVYRETTGAGEELRVEVTVTRQTKDVAGVKARVVHDVVTRDGALVEDTYDWYAQDRAGNVWYLGEDTKDYEDGKVRTTEGSWEAGVDGAQAGVVMPARPRPGMRYRQEHYPGHAEDAGEILSLDEQAEVPFGRFRGVLKTRDYTPLQPDLVENKFYAKGIGPVLAVEVSGGSDREELLRFDAGGA